MPDDQELMNVRLWEWEADVLLPHLGEGYEKWWRFDDFGASSWGIRQKDTADGICLA